jgi:serine protein kinase
MEARRYLSDVVAQVKQSFVQSQAILAFDEYLDLFLKEPRLHARSSAQYLKDTFEFFGTDEVQTPAGPVKRYRLFDGVEDAREAKVSGQEEVQVAIARIIANLARVGRVNKLVLLHGPNGSAKTSIVSAIVRAMEAYGRTPQGAQYRFNWIFPSEKYMKGAIGFGEKTESTTTADPSYAHLDREAIDARLSCELKDHPLFFIPRVERRKLLEKSCKAAPPAESRNSEDFVLSDYILDGELCPKCRSIEQALLRAYHGDYTKVLKHVQVERFYVSRRYQTAAVTVEPQMSVDAGFHQVTADKSHGNLPPALHNVSLFEPYGPLVAANRGLIEYSDLLKRPLEAFKYLLGTTETGVVPLEHILLQIDEVYIATSNEKHLAAFKDLPDFASFKGRIELVRVPYLRRHGVEKEIYDIRVTDQTAGRHVAPHATSIAAMWAVLTRLKKPNLDRYPGDLRDIVDDLAPIEKMKLYDTREPPDRLSLAQAKELRKYLVDLYRESDAYPNYEGRAGASAREIKTVLFNAALNPASKCLTPAAVIQELESLCKDKSIYEFLQQEVVDGYHDHEEFVRTVEKEYLDTIDDEIRDSMGLVAESQYRELFERYVFHVSHWVKGEKVRNKITGAYDKPDEELMAHVEGIVIPEDEDRSDFRKGLIATIGAYRLDHPDDEIEYVRIFPDLFRKLRDHYFEERRKTLRRNKENVLRYLSNEKQGLSPKEISQVENMLATMTSRYQYCEHCARDAILLLMRKRYSD